MASPWTWAAWGKHPIASDYLSIGQNQQMIAVFSRWVEDAYDRSANRPDAGELTWSWRFWGQGPRRDSLICGLIKGSSDRIGRHYPFLILGNGPLKQWEKYWELLAFACETTWNRMEAAAVRATGTLEHMEQELRRLPPPAERWDLYQQKLSAIDPDAVKLRPAGSVLRNYDPQAALYQTEKGMVKVRLPMIAGVQQAELIDGLHGSLGSLLKDAPQVVFIGGSMNQTYLVAFSRLLVSDDFNLLLGLGTGRMDWKEPGKEMSIR